MQWSQEPFSQHVQSRSFRSSETCHADLPPRTGIPRTKVLPSLPAPGLRRFQAHYRLQAVSVLEKGILRRQPSRRGHRCARREASFASKPDEPPWVRQSLGSDSVLLVERFVLTVGRMDPARRSPLKTAGRNKTRAAERTELRNEGETCFHSVPVPRCSNR